MILLYSSLIMLVMVSVAVLGKSFYKKRQAHHLVFVILVLLLFFSSLIMYSFSGNKKALAAWFSQGKQHYQLQETFSALGGLEGAIDRIEKKLLLNPDDAEGWLILSKLYRAHHDDEKAKLAFERYLITSPGSQKTLTRATTTIRP